MTSKTILAAVAALTLPASAGDYLLGGSNDSAVSVGFTEGARNVASGVGDVGRTIVTAPARILDVRDALPPMLAKGTQEFGLSGNVNFADDIAYNLNLTYGWFIRDCWEVGFIANVQGVESDVNFGLGIFTEYNFARNNSKWVPFVGFDMSWAKLDSDAFDADSIALGLNVGIKYFIRENISLSFSVGADYAFDDVFPGGDDFQEQINIGTRFYF